MDGATWLRVRRAEVDKWLLSHPEANVEVPTQLVRDVKPGSRIIYTPPYESWTQPIELIWNQAKHEVAEGAHKNRKLEETQAAMKKALQGIRKEDCTRTIGKVHHEINLWLKKDDAGWLRPFKTLETLIAASAEERETAYRRFVNGEVVTEDEESTKENQPEAAIADDSVRGRSKRQKSSGWRSVAK